MFEYWITDNNEFCVQEIAKSVRLEESQKEEGVWVQ